MRRATGVVAIVLVFAACTEPWPAAETQPSDPTPVGSTAPGSPSTLPDDGSVVARYAGKPWFAGTVPDQAVPADVSLPPIVVGLINMENAAVGSFPELRAAAVAAIGWINTELGGVDGRPIELRTCITSFSVEQSQACAQSMVRDGAVAVISGVDVTSNGSIPVLQQNGIPMISALPTTLAELQGADVYSFSGSITGAYVAFVSDAYNRGARSIAIAYGQFESFEVPAQYAAKVARSLGMQVTLIPFGVVTADFLPIVQAAVDSGAGAVTIAAADSACVPIMTGLADLGFTGRVYMVGACGVPPILAQVPDEVQAAVVFNNEGTPGDAVEGPMFELATRRYTDELAGGAGSVTFRAAMNLWAALTQLDGDVSPARIAEFFAGAVAEPSFWGHPYTCDGKQVVGLPALCAPQQSLVRYPDDSGVAVLATDRWIDVPALVAAAG